jgi:hypothetical protein
MRRIDERKRNYAQRIIKPTSKYIQHALFIPHRLCAALSFRIASQLNVSCAFRKAGSVRCDGSLSRINRSYPKRKMNFHSGSLNPLRITALGEFVVSCPKFSRLWQSRISDANAFARVQHIQSARRRFEAQLRIFRNIYNGIVSIVSF